MREREIIKTLIVDDEPVARKTICALIEKDPEIDIVGECGNGFAAVELIEAKAPQLVFLDIQMPGLNGFEVLASLETQEMPVIVFVTAFDRYALKAFDVHALDYLLKPYSDSRFYEALELAKSRVQQRQLETVNSQIEDMLRSLPNFDADKFKKPAYIANFRVKSGNRVLLVNTGEVDWLAADDYYVKLHVGGKTHLLRVSMNDLETRLDPQRFLRIHRSTIINCARLKGMCQHANGEHTVLLSTGEELKVSRSRREKVTKLLASMESTQREISHG